MQLEGAPNPSTSHVLRSIIALLILSFFGSGISWGQTPPMQFEAYPPDWFLQNMMGNHVWKIFATGEIDANAAKRLSALVDSKQIPEGSMLYLNSLGGSLLGGLALGRAIRAHGLNTAVGQYNFKLKYVGSKPGYCYSACAFAFLGGVFRYSVAGSIYGVHRFYWEAGTGGNAPSAEILSAAVVEYIQSMGVDPKIFSIATEAGRSQMVIPSHRVLLALRVVNNGQLPTKWTIESYSRDGVQGMYLKGQRETDNGINKFIIACQVGAPMFLMAIFDVGQNGKQVMSWPVNWLFVDNKDIRIDRFLESKSIKNGEMVIAYRIDNALLRDISGAKTVGVGLQGGVGAAVYSGFNHMSFKGGAKKLPGYLSVCQNRGH